MAADADAETAGFGHVSRVRGVLFENLTRLASLVGVLALVVLIVSIALDAFRPFTADPSWYLVYAVTLGLPVAGYVIYFQRDRAAKRVGIRSLGVTTAGGALAGLMVLTLGGMAALIQFITTVVPMAAFLAYLVRQRRAGVVALQVVGVVFVGGILAGALSFFLGAGRSLVYLVAVGAPAIFLVRYFLSHPEDGRVGTTATVLAILGALVGAAAVEVATGLLELPVGTSRLTAAGFTALAVTAGYGVRTLLAGEEGALGLLTPVILLAGSLVGYVFNARYLIVGSTTLYLLGVTVGLPYVGYALLVTRTRNEGVSGLGLPLIAGAGALTGHLFYTYFLLAVPAVETVFLLATALPLFAYAAALQRYDRDGLVGTGFPLVVVGGVVLGTLLTSRFGVAGPETWLDIGFLTSLPSRDPTQAGVYPALLGTVYLMFLVALVSFPVGVGAAVYLEEYAPNNRATRLLEINISNLAGVPSVVYGILGLAVFVRYGGFQSGALIVGGLTLSLLILPIVIISAQEAIRAVPDSIRRASYGMGATQWQTIRNVVLPRALPGILTGTILALGRAIGETAPLIMIGAPTVIFGPPEALTEQATAMPLQVFEWALSSKPLFRTNISAAGSITLLILLLSMNAVAIIIRNRYQRQE